jgi:hypothetical protein
LLRNNNIQALPNIVLEFPDINALGPLCVVNELGANPSSLALGGSEQVLLACIFTSHTTALAIIPWVVIKAWTKVIIVEELGVEGSGSVVGLMKIVSSRVYLELKGLTIVLVVLAVCRLFGSGLGPEVLVDFAVAVVVHPDAFATHFELRQRVSFNLEQKKTY